MGDMADVNDRKIMTQPELVDHIMEKSLEFFGMSKDDLKAKFSKSDLMWQKKRYIAFVLSNNTLLPLREIGSLVGFNSHDLVLYHINAMKDEVSDHAYGSIKTKKLYKNLLTYLNLES